MTRIFAMTAAVVLVLLQLGAIAAWTVEPPLHLPPLDGPELVAEQRV